MLKRTITTLFSVASVLLLTNQASTQNAPPTPGANTAGVDASANLDEIPADEMPEVRRMVEDEASHRDRLARINRLRELAQSNNDRERLAKLDDLERREQNSHEQRRIRARERMSDSSWQNTQSAMNRSGRIRMRMAAKDSADAAAARARARDRAAQQKEDEAKAQRERARAAGADKSRSNSTAPRSGGQRSGGQRSGGNSSGGRSPR